VSGGMLGKLKVSLEVGEEHRGTSGAQRMDHGALEYEAKPHKCEIVPVSARHSTGSGAYHGEYRQNAVFERILDLLVVLHKVE
jgi:hypothetical protein